MAGEWLTPEQRAEARGDAKVEKHQAEQDDRDESAALRADEKFYHYSDAWYGMEPR
jgi:hypothetical protein